MLSCYRPGYRPVLGNIISVILGQSKCFLATDPATDRYWATLFQSYWDRANAFLLQTRLQTGTGQHYFSHIGTEQMLSCYRQVLGNIISVILGQSKCFLATDPATDRYWATLFQSYWDRANAFLLQTRLQTSTGQHYFSHIGTEQMLSCYRPVLGNIMQAFIF